MKKKLSFILCLVLTICSVYTPDVVVAKKKVKLNKKKVVLFVGKSVKLKVKGTKAKVKWKSNKKKIATVSKKGKVKAKKKGTAKITARVGKKKLVCKVKVKARTGSDEDDKADIENTAAAVPKSAMPTGTGPIAATVSVEPGVPTASAPVSGVLPTVPMESQIPIGPTMAAESQPPAEPTAEIPGESNAPLASEVPSKSSMPSVSGRPEESKVPTASERPEESNMPIVSERPEESKVPIVSERPEESKVPAASETPEVTAPASVKPSVSPHVSTAPSGKPDQTTTDPTKEPDPSASPTVTPTFKPTPTLKPTPSLTPTPVPTPFRETVIKKASFENGTDGFAGRGSASVKSVADGQSGNALSVTGRSATWNGAGIDLKSAIVLNASYRLTVYVRMAAGAGTKTLDCSYDDGNGYPSIAQVNASEADWTRMEAEFTVTDEFKKFEIYFQIPSDSTASFYIDEFELTQLTKGGPPEEVELTSMKSVSDPVFGKTGTCINLSQLQDSDTLKYVKEHYSSITLENEMKPDNILGGSCSKINTTEARNDTDNYVIPDNYKESTVPALNFRQVDAALKIAKENGLKMRGHTLVWHSQTPEWFFKVGYNGSSNDYVSKAVMDARLEMYVRSVLHHIYTLDSGAYRDVLYVWDIANEYTHNDNENVNGKDKAWSAVYGNRTALGMNPPYVKKAFEIAYDELTKLSLQEEIPLFYNDFNTYIEKDNIIALVNYINQGESNKICQGIGMQSHLDVDYPLVNSYLDTVQAFITAGYDVQVTELDVTINNASGSYKDENQTDEDQAAYMAKLIGGLSSLQNETHGITGLTLWGLYDEVSWRKASSPLLFGDHIYDPKPSYYKFIQALQSA